MPPDLTLRLDAPTTRAHRSLEIASRFPQHPPRNDPLPHGRRQLHQALVTAHALLNTGAPLSGVAAFEVFLSGRFWTFGETHLAPPPKRVPTPWSRTAESRTKRCGGLIGAYALPRRESACPTRTSSPAGMESRRRRHRSHLLVALFFRWQAAAGGHPDEKHSWLEGSRLRV
jgi:hypothetical protein